LALGAKRCMPIALKMLTCNILIPEFEWGLGEA